MKRIFLILFCVGFTTVVCGQDSTQAPWDKYPYTFQFNVYNFALQPFNNGAIAFKYNMKNSSAIRLVVRLNGGSQTEKAWFGAENKNEWYYATIFLHYISYRNPEDDLCAYWGVGPSYTRTFRKYLQFYQDTNMWEVGIGGIIGVSWIVHKRITIDAEYGLQINRGYSENILSTGTAWSIDNYGLFHFGVSV